MATGRTRKRLGKHKYFWVNTHKDKASALAEAKNYREIGYLSRVAETPHGNYDVWAYPDPWKK